MCRGSVLAVAALNLRLRGVPQLLAPFYCRIMQTITECQSIFDFRLPSVIIPDRCKTLCIKYESCNNLLYKLALSPLYDFLLL